MAEVFRRVSVLGAIDGFDSAPVDLALPGGLPVGALIPAVVDLVGDNPGEHACRYRLSSLGGEPMDDSISLIDNGIRDGDVLVLSAAHPGSYRPIHDDPCLALSTEMAADRPVRAVRVAIFLWTCAATMVALGWAAMTLGHGLPLAVAALLGVASAAAGVMQHRTGDSPGCGALHLVSAAFAGLVGLIAVPGPLSPAGLFLASVAVSAASVIQLRFSGCGTTPLTACAVSAGVFAVVLGGAAMWTVSVAVVGAAAIVLSLVVLGVTPRASIALSGLSPTMPSADDEGGRDVDMRQVIRGHHLLTGAVVGVALAAALGAVLIAAGCLHGEPPWPAAGFTAATGAAIALRLRTHADPVRRRALVASGIVCLSGSFVIGIAAAPVVTPWLCVAVSGAAAAALVPLGGATSPTLRRSVDVVEYVSLAAVVPLGCWVADVYGLVRGVSLS